MAYRVDHSALGSATYTDQGFLRVPATVGKVGVLTYINADGSQRREYRPAEELFAPESLDTLRMAIVTNNHPRADMLPLSPASAPSVHVGHVGEVTITDPQTGELQVMMQVTSSEALSAIAAGRQQISPGYVVELDMTPGVWDGMEYDAIQRKIRYDHVALVDRARGGPDLRVHLDSADNVVMEEPMSEPVIETPVVEAAPVAVVEETPAVDLTAALEAELQKLRGELAAQTARADAAEAALVSLPAQLKTQFQARLALEKRAAEVLPGVSLDSMSDEEIKAAAVAHLLPSMKLDSATPEYLSAAFEVAMHTRLDVAATPGLLAIRADAESATPSLRKDERARAKMIEENRNAWKSR